MSTAKGQRKDIRIIIYSLHGANAWNLQQSLDKAGFAQVESVSLISKIVSGDKVDLASFCRKTRKAQM